MTKSTTPRDDHCAARKARNFPFLGALLLGCMLQGAFAAAGEPDAKPGAIWSLSLENDLFANADRHYTNGIRLSYLGAESDIPAWISQAADAFPLFAAEGKRRVGFALGQSMYTPQDITRRPPDPTDRPFAGWLYGSAGVISETETRLDALEFDLGIVGPDSLADRAQKFVHGITKSRRPQGWDFQLHDEPGVLLSYQRKWRGL